MHSRATIGTARRSETCAARSGRTRSNAAAKIIRVDDRNSVPDQPRNQAPNSTTIDLEDRVVHEVRGEQRRVSPDRDRRSGGRVAVEVVDELTFVALKKSQPNVFAARSTNTIARPAVTQIPPSMPRRTLRKSPEPRTSPYSVDPQFGYRIQNSMNGIIARVAVIVAPMSVPNASGSSDPVNASFAAASAIVLS